MKKYKIQIEFKSDWHIGTGIGLPGTSDDMLLRDNNDYPFIPGRTIKGILRNTHEQFLSRMDYIDTKYSPKEIWGTHNLVNKDEFSRSGAWVVDNGDLDWDLMDTLNSLPDDIRKIWLNEFSFISPRIALDEKHKTKEKHLAFIELGRKGLTFFSNIYRKDGEKMNENELSLLRLILLTTQRLGGLRRRGKGRTKFILEQDNNLEKMRREVKGGLNV